ncbi:IS256 family transposase, partial [Listeria welshimeri]|nr:IS256 family transposase [Listeria welshimeri]
MPRKKRDPKTVALAKAIVEEYQPESVEEMQSALKDVFGPLFEQLLQGEMEHHLGYSAHSREDKEDDNRRNGYGTKTVRTSYGEV